MHVLIVEDDPRIASFLDKGLRAEGYVTTVATNAVEANAYSEALEGDLSLVLLDLGLPDGSGDSVLQRLRQRRSDVSIIILTARTDVSDKVRGLDLGANDYVTKPFVFEELLARVRAALRTSAQPTTTSPSPSCSRSCSHASGPRCEHRRSRPRRSSSSLTCGSTS